MLNSADFGKVVFLSFFIVAIIMILRNQPFKYEVRNSNTRRPNIVFILTDDQDAFGATLHIPKAKQYIGNEGINFTNTFVTTPVCCPSRLSTLTGMYAHNHHGYNNTIDGGCGNKIWEKKMEPNAFATYLKKQNYNTFFAGKYLNSYGRNGPYVPPGWDVWSGLYGNSEYYHYTLSVNGEEEHHGEKPEDYLTDLINRRALEFIEEQTNEGSPFFAMLSTPAVHLPVIPRKKYENLFLEEKAPRDPNYDFHEYDKHWLVSSHTPMSERYVQNTDELFVRRAQTLLSVEDMVEDVVTKLAEKDMLKTTYIIYTSDNGYHLGQFSLVKDKRQLYEFDIRVPFLIRGPGITPNQVRKEPILNIDLAPTFLDIAGVPIPENMDGKSFLPLLNSKEETEPKDWRMDFMVEYWGESNDLVYKRCPNLDHEPVFNCNTDCHCVDARNNSYSCVRTITDEQNLMYCKFADDVEFEEYYNLTEDPYQLKNLAFNIPKTDQSTEAILKQQERRRKQLFQCQGQTCQQLPEVL